MKIHSNLENISGPPSNLCRLLEQIRNRSAIWLSLFLQHCKMRVADKAYYFTILENWRRFMKVLRNTLNDNNSVIKRKGREEEEKKVELFARRTAPLVLIWVLNVLNELLSVILRLITRETALLSPAGELWKANSRLFTIIYRKTPRN